MTETTYTLEDPQGLYKVNLSNGMNAVDNLEDAFIEAVRYLNNEETAENEIGVIRYEDCKPTYRWLIRANRAVRGFSPAEVLALKTEAEELYGRKDYDMTLSIG